jgi:hypothetical protein
MRGVKRRREATLARADGVVLAKSLISCSIDQHHPVRSIKDASRYFFLMSRPPLLG